MRFVIAMVSLIYFGSMLIIINAHTFAGAVLFGVVFGVAQGGWTVSPAHRGAELLRTPLRRRAYAVRWG